MAAPEHEHAHEHDHDAHEHSEHGQPEHGQPEHGQPDHVHDDNCAVAHGAAPAPEAQQRTLVAVFASPVASYLLRYAADAGYRTVLIEPDPERAKAAANGFELADGVATAIPADGSVAVPAGGQAALTDLVVTDHHRDELGVVLRDALAAEIRWVGIMGNPRVEGPHIKALTELGVPPGEVSKVHRPIGLNIGSRLPAEIAIATLAGLIADRNGKPGGFAF